MPTVNSSKLPKQIEQALLKHLVSENRFESLSFLNGSIDYTGTGTSRQSVQSRLEYLRNKKNTDFEGFLEHLLTNEIDFSFDELEAEHLHQSSPTKKEQTTPTKSKRSAIPRTPRTPSTSNKQGMSEVGAPAGSAIIDVDLSRPEQNREIIILEANNIKASMTSLSITASLFYTTMTCRLL
jgi:hypothetical protein